MFLIAVIQFFFEKSAETGAGVGTRLGRSLHLDFLEGVLPGFFESFLIEPLFLILLEFFPCFGGDLLRADYGQVRKVGGRAVDNYQKRHQSQKDAIHSQPPFHTVSGEHVVVQGLIVLNRIGL